MFQGNEDFQYNGKNHVHCKQFWYGDIRKLTRGTGMEYMEYMIVYMA